MSTVKRIVTMREHPVGPDSDEKAGTPNAIQVGRYTVAKSKPLEVELDVDTWQDQQQLRAFEKEPCVRVEEPEEHQKRVAAEAKPATEGPSNEGGQPSDSGSESKGGGKSGKGGSGGKSG